MTGKERAMGVRGCIPTNKQSDGGRSKERWRGSYRNRNSKGTIRDAGRK